MSLLKLMLEDSKFLCRIEVFYFIAFTLIQRIANKIEAQLQAIEEEIKGN